MPASSLSRLIALRIQPTGRMIFASTKTLELVDPEREPGLAEKIEECIKQFWVTYGLEGEWAKAKVAGKQPRSQAVKLDPLLSRAISKLYTYLDGSVVGDDDEPEDVAARKVLSAIFPLGVGAITQLPYVEEVTAVEGLLRELKGPLAVEAELLGLERHIRAIQGLVSALRNELTLVASEDLITWDKVAASQYESQELYAGVILTILARYSSNEPCSVARRQELLREILQQDAALKEMYRRKRGTVDVDPRTGGEVESPPEIPVETQPAA